MPLYRLLRNAPFDSQHVEVMSSAFEDICRDLGLAVRDDPLRDMVARAIIECAQKGIRDPVTLRRCAREAI